jgi:hypothetical protein
MANGSKQHGHGSSHESKLNGSLSVDKQATAHISNPTKEAEALTGGHMGLTGGHMGCSTGTLD